ncbi:MAG TPA: PrsW family glutamic-type intramembrane protease [Caulobacteraceae bacterium]|nr:PrsW family glutamic-type intramembrane protease [Caulobacteraceae bacterium]
MELILVKILIALGPVLIFLAVFDWLDAFKLVSRREIVLLLIGGGLLAIVSYAVNGRFIDAMPMGFSPFSRFISPPIEEGLKCALIFALFQTNRIGFVIDAAIVGVSVGAGFSVAENLIYIGAFTHANLGVWVVRGFGTAIMHAGAGALFATLGQHFTERFTRAEAERHRFECLYFLPGLGLAILAHSIFNQFAAQPIIAMALTVFLVPMLLFMILMRSEDSAHKWLLTDHESHQHMLDDIREGRLAGSPQGRFVRQLAEQFPPDIGAAMFRYIQVHTWLVTKAEEDLIDLHEGRPEDLGESVRANLQELHDLEKKIGRTGVLALSRHMHFSRGELWEIHELEAHLRHEHPKWRTRPKG